MRFPLANVLLLFPLLSSGALLAPGCARQNEGERCSRDNGDNDCDGDLVCRSASELKNGEDGVSRCCPEDDAETPEDDRCRLRTGVTGTGGGSGLGGQGQGGEGGSTQSDGDTDLGAACDYTSECKEPLVCGPQGRCQHECQTDRDCAEGNSCTLQRTCEPG